MAEMIAMVVPAQGGRFVREARALPEPGTGEVRIKVEACGVCHSDSIAVEGLMPGVS
jgi:D-arabinose 1-dehydrogenase-like Zn-dependent alcohol dehydrogenase